MGPDNSRDPGGHLKSIKFNNYGDKLQWRKYEHLWVETVQATELVGEAKEKVSADTLGTTLYRSLSQRKKKTYQERITEGRFYPNSKWRRNSRIQTEVM